MKPIVYRNCSLVLLIVSSIIYGLAGILCGVIMYAALVIEDPLFIPILRYFTAFCYAAVSCICIVGIVTTGIAFTEKIIISEDAVEFHRGKQMIRHISSQEITVCGYASFIHRDAYVFFCATSLEEILMFSKGNQKKSLRYFGRRRIMQAKTDSDCEFQIAVGTYIHSQRRKNRARIIILKNPGPKTLKEIREILHQEPVRTGRILMDYPNMWTE